MNLIDTKIAEAVCDLIKQKDEYILEKFKELMLTGAIWLEESNIVMDKTDSETLHFLESRNLKCLKMCQDFRFCFDGIKAIDDLKEKNNLLEERIYELESLLGL